MKRYKWGFVFERTGAIVFFFPFLVVMVPMVAAGVAARNWNYAVAAAFVLGILATLVFKPWFETWYQLGTAAATALDNAFSRLERRLRNDPADSVSVLSQ